MAEEVDKAHQFAADGVVEDGLVQDLPIYPLILHSPYVGLVIYRIHAGYLPRDDVLQTHKDLLLLVLPDLANNTIKVLVEFSGHLEHYARVVVTSFELLVDVLC